MADINLATGVTVTVRPPDTPTILSGPPQTTATVTPPVFNVTIGAPLTPGLVAGVGTSATVMPGTAGPAGADGAPGPQGEPGPPGADGEGGGSTGGRLLSGSVAPLSGSGLEPLDGTSDPWRWSSTLGGWVSPTYDVTWQTGATVPSLTALPAGAEELVLYIGAIPALSPAAFFATPPAFTDATLGPSLSENFTTAGSGPLTADADGAGVAFLVQYESGYAGPTAVPDPTLDIATMLGDVTIDGPHTWDESGDGGDGDFWLDKTTMQLYGPKTAGAWPAPDSVKGFVPSAYTVVTGGWNFQSIADPANPALTVEGTIEPDASYLNPGQVSLWYDPTAGAPAVHFKAKDADGTVSDIQLDGSTGGRLLSGTAAPLSGSGLDPLDGINDPWRWSAMLGGWVGPVYETTWLAGDEVPELLTVPTGANRVDLFIGSFTTLAESLTTTPPFSTGGTPTLSEGIFDNGFGLVATTGPLIADADGAGITFLLQTEIGFTHTTVPDPTLDITTMLGDVTAGAPYTFAETGDGDDGDYWRDTLTGDIYGPKTTGTWAGVIGKLFDPATYQVVSEPWFFFTDDGEAPINFSGGPTEPADIDINTGCIALWYDNTAAAPAVNFKAKDADGTVYVATLPMTPA